MRRFVNSIESIWRHRFVYPVLRFIIRNPQIDKPIDILSVKKLLILRYDRIGDMIITTPIFRNLKQMNPNLKIGVFANKINAEIIRNNPYVDVIYIKHTNWLLLIREILKVKSENYDVVINFIFNRTTTCGILANIVCPSGIKVGEGFEKHKFYYNRLLKLPRSSGHMVETLSLFIRETFGMSIDSDMLSFEIFVDDHTKSKIQNYLQQNALRSRYNMNQALPPYIVFNLSATDGERRISAEQAFEIGKHLASHKEHRTILLLAPNDQNMIQVTKRLVKTTECLIFPEQGTASLLEIAALLGHAIAVITPDTSIIHFASAAKTPVVGFYTQLQRTHEWLPHLVKNSLVFSAENEPTSAIPIPKMINAIDDFMKELEIESIRK